MTVIELPGRGLIHLEGPDRRGFLQGLVTNDVRKLSPAAPLYACLLTPQGKFLHDFFLLEGDGFTLMDCEGGARARDLYERLLKYRLRADVRISLEENIPVHAALPSSPRPEGQAYADPRHPALGWRTFSPPPAGAETGAFRAWDRLRISLGVPDGSRDMAVERDTILECGIDRLHGVSFDKGCYVGQEITARMHYRGLAKKILRTVSAGDFPEGFPSPFSEIRRAGVLTGEMRSSCGDLGLALMKRGTDGGEE